MNRSTLLRAGLAFAAALAALHPGDAQSMKIDRIEVSGNRQISTEAILRSVSTKPGDELSAAALDRDQESIRRMGFFRSVAPPRVEDTPEGKKVVFVVSEWPVVREIKISGNTAIPTEAIRAALSTKEGAVLNTPILERDIDAIRCLYTEKGYVAMVTEEVGLGFEQSGLLNIPILEAIVGAVRIRGNRTIPEAILRGELKHLPGTRYNTKALAEDFGRLQRLPLLESVQPAPAPMGEVGKIEVTWNFEERPFTSLPALLFEVGIGWSGREGVVLNWGTRRDPLAEIAALRKAMTGDARDAERYLRLGRLYAETEETREAALAEREPAPGPRMHAAVGISRARNPVGAKASFARAVALYRRQVTARPQDGRLLAAYGAALDAAGKTADAERVLRRAVKIAPREWRAWVALGEVLSGRQYEGLWQGGVPTATLDPESALRQLSQLVRKKPSPAQIERSRKVAKEAARCFDQAVVVAPREPRVYARRATFSGSRALSQIVIDGIGGEPVEFPAAILDTIFAPDCLADVQQVARLSPGDYRAIGSAILFEVFRHFLFETGGMPEPDDQEAWRSLPETTRASARRAAARLLALSRSRDAETASGAATLLVFLQELVFKESAAAEATLRRAILRDPSCEPAWALLTLLKQKGEDRRPLIDAGEALLKQKDSVQGRLMLARAYEDSDQPDQAMEQLRAVLKLKPDHFAVHVALAVLLLKQEAEPSALPRADALLQKAGRLPTGTASSEERAHFAIARGVYYSRTGDLAKARQAFLRAGEIEAARKRR